MGDSEYSYGNMATYIGNLVDEAINSTMHLCGFGGSVQDGFDGMVGGSAVKITPLGGHYEGSGFVQGGRAYDPTTGLESVFVVPSGWGFPFRDLPGMQSYYWDRANRAFDPWWQAPTPAGFDAQVAQARKAAHALAYQGGDGSTSTGPGAGYFTANQELRHIQTIQQRVSNLNGDAILAFEDNFSNRMDDVVNAQDAAACLAWVGIAGERNIWVKTQESLANIAGAGVEAMKGADGGGGGGVGALINVLGAIALITAEFATDGLATPLVVAGVAAQTASDFVPEPAEDERKPLDADTPFGVFDKIDSALEDLKGKIGKEENWISTKMQKMTNLFYGGSRGGFSLSEPPLAHEDRKSQLYEPGEIKANFETMKTVANQYMTAVSSQLSSAAGLFDDSGPGPWDRPGDIGLGSTGAYSEWSGLNLAIKGVVGKTATSIDTAADALVIVANDFGKTDGRIKADMDGLGKRLDDARASASRAAH